MDLDLEKDKLFDPLGLKRLRESYMMKMRHHHRRDSLMYQMLWI